MSLLFLSSCQDKALQPEYVRGEPATQVGAAIMERTGLVASLYYDTQTEIVDGLTLSTIGYLGMDGYPMKMWFLKADLTKDNISLDQVWALDSFGSGAETLTSMANKVDSEDNYVLCAINSDFGTGRGPQGIFHHEGICYKSTFDVLGSNPDRPRCFFYLTSDKKLYMADASRYDEIKASVPDIVEASAGSPLLIDDGMIISIPDQSDELTNRHPRTCIGVEKDHTTVWMMVADGRRYSWSNGLQYPELSQIMAAVGCHYMMNLDGGGSSEMIVRNRDESAGKFSILNWTNDRGGAERELSTAILIVTKK